MTSKSLTCGRGDATLPWDRGLETSGKFLKKLKKKKSGGTDEKSSLGEVREG